MGLLLDSAALLWFAVGDPRLGPVSRERIEEDPQVAISVASVWELEAKRTAGDLSGLEGPIFPEDGAFELLEIGLEDALLAARLPQDVGAPLDRIIVAQARRRGLGLVTPDPTLARLGAPVLDATF